MIGNGLAVELMKFGVRGIGPATKAAQRNQMDKAIRIFGRAALGRATFEGLSMTRWDQVMANNIRAEYIGSGFAPLSEADIRDVATPTLLVTGQKSPRLWPMLTTELDSLLAESELVEIPGASHIVHEDNTDAFNQVVLAFLGSRS